MGFKMRGTSMNGKNKFTTKRGKLNIAVGDGDVMSFYDEEIRTFKTLKMQERADAESDTAGYGHKVLGVTNIAKVNGVTSIAKVIGK